MGTTLLSRAMPDALVERDGPLMIVTMNRPHRKNAQSGAMLCRMYDAWLEASADDESFADDLLEYPHYTRPAEFRGWSVPDVLRSGDHGRIERWRRAEALARTLQRRPDLIERRGGLTSDEVRLLQEHGYPGEPPRSAAEEWTAP